MEVTVNNANNEATQQEPQQLEKMSEFCEALMDAAEKLNEKATDSDFALVICGDGNKLATRFHGRYGQVLHGIVALMEGNDNFAELLLEASSMFSRHLLGRRAEKQPNEQNQ